jgi:thiamine-phosphate pyrophosphorylase
VKPTIDYTLYLVTDRSLMSSKTLEDSVTDAIAGGATVIQLREKAASSREFFELALRIHNITVKTGVPLIINDRIDIALAINAEGVHIGQSDLPCGIVRKIIGHDKILGVSASNLNDAKAAWAEGADYLGVGAMFATDTKSDANITSLGELAAIRKAVDLPIVVIGGINASTIPHFAGSGIDGIAVVSAVIAAPDVSQAACEIKALFRRTCL